MRKRIVVTVSIVLMLFLGVVLGFTFNSSKSSGKTTFKKFNDVNNLESQKDIDDAIKYFKVLAADKKNEPKLDGVYYNLGILYEKKSKFELAKEYYSKIMSNYMASPLIASTQARLGDLNVKMLFSSEATPSSKIYEVQSGDTLGRISKRFGTTVDLIQKSNNIKGDHIRPKMKLKVNTSKFSIIVDKSENILTLKENEEVFKVYRVATGLNGCTPVGTFTVINKIVDPVWYTEDAMVPSGSPKNILGTRWLGLSAPHYGIHGSNDPSDIGKQVTAGCVRMKNNEVEELYTIVPVNTEVTIVE